MQPQIDKIKLEIAEMEGEKKQKYRDLRSYQNEIGVIEQRVQELKRTMEKVYVWYSSYYLVQLLTRTYIHMLNEDLRIWTKHNKNVMLIECISSIIDSVLRFSRSLFEL